MRSLECWAPMARLAPVERFVDVGANVFLDLVDPLEMLSQNCHAAQVSDILLEATPGSLIRKYLVGVLLLRRSSPWTG